MAQQHHPSNSDLHHLPPSSATSTAIPVPPISHHHLSSSLPLATSNTSIAPIVSTAQPVASTAPIDPFTMSAGITTSAAPATTAPPLAGAVACAPVSSAGVKDMSKGDILAAQKAWRMEKRRELEERNKKKQARLALNDHSIANPHLNSNINPSIPAYSAPVSVPPMKRYKAAYLAPESNNNNNAANVNINLPPANNGVVPDYQHYEYVGAHTIQQPPPSPSNANVAATTTTATAAGITTSNAPATAPVITPETIEAQRLWKEQKRRDMIMKKSKIQSGNGNANCNSNSNQQLHHATTTAVGAGSATGSVSKRGRQPRKRAVDGDMELGDEDGNNGNSANNSNNDSALINVQPSDIVTSMGVPQKEEQIYEHEHHNHHDADVAQGLPTTVIQPAEVSEEVVHHTLPPNVEALPDDGTNPLEPLNDSNEVNENAGVASEAMLTGVTMALPAHGETHQLVASMVRHPLDHTNPLAQYTSFDEHQKKVNGNHHTGGTTGNNANHQTNVSVTVNVSNTYGNDAGNEAFQMVEGNDDIIGAAATWTSLGNINHN